MASTGTIVVLSIALLCTVFGVGALGRAGVLFDGRAWLWSSPVGQVSRVDPETGDVDLVADVPESAGHRVEVTQTDGHLILHDVDSGRMTSIDLSEMAFSGRLDLGEEGDYGLVLDGDSALLVDRAGGEVRAVDPATFKSTGETLKLPAPIEGGAFDANGTLWVGAPSQGTVVGVTIADGTAKIDTTHAVADPGDDIALTVLDSGPLLVNRSDDAIVQVRDGETTEVDSPIDLKDAVVPERTAGSVAAVTAPGADAVLTLADGSDDIDVVRADGIGKQPAVPYEGRVYLPSGKSGAVRVFEADGTEGDPLKVPDAKGRLRLEVREGSLFVNSPDSGAALVVGPSGKPTSVDKYATPPGPGGTSPGGPGGQDDPGPTPAPGTGPTASPGTGNGADDPGSDEPRRGGPDLDPGTEPKGDAGVALPTPPPAAPVTVPSVDGPGASTGGGSAGGTAGRMSLVPGAPVPVTAAAGDGQAAVSWQSAFSPSGEVAQYALSWDGGSKLVSGERRSTVVDGLRNGVSYRIQVQAVNVHGYGLAATSQEVVPGEKAPSTPRDLKAKAKGPGTAELAWSAVEGAADYVIAGTTNAEDGLAVRTTSTTSITVTGLEPGRTYRFTVAARTDGGKESAAARARAVKLPHLAAPETVRVAIDDQDTLRVYWTPVKSGAEYIVTPAADTPVFQPQRLAAGEPVVIDGVEYQTAVFEGAGNHCYQFSVQALDDQGNTSAGSDPSRITCHATRR